MPLPSIILQLDMAASAAPLSQTRSAGAAVTDHFGGIGTEPNAFPDWVNESNALASDNAYATCTLGTADVSGEWLFLDEFGFTIPAGATIVGIKVEVEIKTDSASNTPQMEDVRLRKEGDVTDVTPFNNTDVTTSDVVYSFGSSSHLWGTTWTVANINHADTGLRLFVEHTLAGGTNVFSLDHVQMTVYYHEAAATGNRRRRLLLAA